MSLTTRRAKNILLLWTDEQRPDSIGCYRSGANANPAISTPAIDRLAQGGVLFEQAYCTQPVCSPARASILTGVYPHTHGVTSNGTVLPASVPTIAELLRAGARDAIGGYACGYIGKWHLGYEHDAQRGFAERWVSTEEYGAGYAGGAKGERPISAYQRFLRERGYRPPEGGATLSREAAARLPEEVGKPAFQASEATRFLEDFRDRPFLLSVNFLEPHPPYFGPLDGLYRAEDMTLPRSWYQGMEETVPLRYRRRREETLREGHKGRLRTNDEAGWKELKAGYWGNATLVDKYIGQILARLEELGLAEDTVVVYTSDHGEMMGDHRILNKGLQYEGSVRVPLMMRAPGLPPQRVSTPISQIHLLPTLLGLVGHPLPPHLQGSDLGPQLFTGIHAPAEGEVVIEWSGYNGYPKEYQRPEPLREPEAVERLLRAVDVRTIRRGWWKLNVHLSGEHELYDLKADPDELHNAYPDAACADVARALYRRLLDWQRETGDRLALPDLTHVPP